MSNTPEFFRIYKRSQALKKARRRFFGNWSYLLYRDVETLVEGSTRPPVANITLFASEERVAILSVIMSVFSHDQRWSGFSLRYRKSSQRNFFCISRISFMENSV